MGAPRMLKRNNNNSDISSHRMAEVQASERKLPLMRPNQVAVIESSASLALESVASRMQSNQKLSKEYPIDWLLLNNSRKNKTQALKAILSTHKTKTSREKIHDWFTLHGGYKCQF